jgi:hypothetical protein
MDIETIKTKIRQREFVFSSHAEEARMDDGLTAQEVVDAILNDEILEQYPDTGRGKSCLVLGFVDGKALHVVCGWRGDLLVIITVYLPTSPHFSDPWTRAG